MQTVVRVLAPMALLLPGAAAGADPPGRELLALQEAVEKAVARAEPAVVCIGVSLSDDPRSPDLGLPDTVPESYGSGLVIADGGLVLTCAHVVKHAKKIYVRLPGGKGSYADIHASDPRSDLAVLRMKDPPRGLRPVTFGDGGKLRKGQFVIGLANPYLAGYRDGSPSASWGIVSNLRRRAPGKLTSESERILQSFHRYGTLIQTDVRLNLGCSGGALLNLGGEVVGITTALAALTGLDAPGGFAVPVDARMRDIIGVLERGEEVEYGFLGVQMQPDARDNEGRGALVSGVLENSPADRAGLTRGDYLRAINGHPVADRDDLFLQVGSLIVGSEVRLEVQRGGRLVALPPVKLRKLYVPGTPVAARRPTPRGGLVVDYGSVLQGRSPSPRVFDAVAVREVVPGSPASKIEELQPDRLITHVNGTPVSTPAEFNRAVDQSGGRARLTVLSPEGREVSVTLDAR